MAVSAKVASAYVDLVARTTAFEKALDDARAHVRSFNQQAAAEMREAKGSVTLLGEEIGIHLPRHLQTFIAKLPGVSEAMSAAFNTVAVLALVDIVFKAGEKVVEFIKKNEDAAKKNAEAWRDLSQPIDSANDKMRVTNDRLEEQIAKLERKPQNRLKTALDEAVDSADTLYNKLVKDNRAAAGLIEKNQVGWGKQALGERSTNDIAGQVTDQQSKTDALSETRASNARGYRDQLDALGAHGREQGTARGNRCRGDQAVE
jgi:hypothetical protein